MKNIGEKRSVVDENLDVARLPGHALERGRDLCIHPVVASNTRNLLLVDYTIVRRPTGHEDPRPVWSERACDPAANAEGFTGDDSDFQVCWWLVAG